MDVVDSGSYVKGENLRRFEEEFANFCSVDHAVGVSSGTSALLLSLLAIGISKGDEVIIPSHTFIATVSPIPFLQGKPIFADIDAETYTINPENIEEKITQNTKAIIPVHLYGHPADMDRINEIAEENDLYVIEDACQAHGSKYNGRKIGPIGDIGCFSFYPSKNMTVYGDGGMVVTNDEKIAEKLKMLRDHGRKEKYVHEILGLNFRLSEMHSAVGRQQLKHLPEWIDKRRKVAGYYNDFLEEIEGIATPIEKNWAKHVYHLYVIRSHQRDQISEHMKANNINTGIHYPIPVHQQPCMRNFGANMKLPVTENYVKEIISLPMHPKLTKVQVEYIVDEIRDFLDVSTC